MYKIQDLEQQFLKTKSNISSKLLDRHQQCNTSDNITERLLSIHSPRLYFECLQVNRGGGGWGWGLEVLLGILGGGVPPSSPFSTPIFRPDL